MIASRTLISLHETHYRRRSSGCPSLSICRPGGIVLRHTIRTVDHDQACGILATRISEYVKIPLYTGVWHVDDQTNQIRCRGVATERDDRYSGWVENRASARPLSGLRQSGEVLSAPTRQASARSLRPSPTR